MLTHTFETSFSPLAKELKQLWLVSKGSIFLHPGYQRVWWQHEGKGTLKLLCVRDVQTLVGFLPLYSENGQEWRIVGAVDLSDYLGILYQPKYEQAVFTEIATALSSLKPNTIKLESICHDSSVLRDLVPVLTQAGFKVTQTQQDVCPGFSLPDSWEKYLASLTPSQAKSFKRLLRDIGRDDDIAYRCLTTPSEIAAHMPTFIRLHKAAEPDKQAFWTPAREAFFTEMATELAKDNLVRLCFLDVNNDPAATILLFDYQNQFLAYNSGFDAYRYGYLGVGNAILLHSIKDAISLGRQYYDFMRGAEDYKFSFGAKSQPLFDLRITQ